LDSRQSKVRELLGDGMAISSATIDREREDEWEDESMREELVHLIHHRLNIIKTPLRRSGS
jgi:hypothetical protein